MKEIIDKLRLGVLAQAERPLLAEDLIWRPSPTAFRPVHQEVALEENPLAIARTSHLESVSDQHALLKQRLVLCWNGFADALSLLSRHADSFQRQVAVGTAVNTAEAFGIGDVGLAWSWIEHGEIDVLAFVRNNVFVSLDGHDVSSSLVAIGRELDAALVRLRTQPRYGDGPSDLFAEVRRRAGDRPRLSAGQRLDLGVMPASEVASLFFLTGSGSVNRTPNQPDRWYYRAGSKPGAQEIVAFRVGHGILPTREQLVVEVV